MSKFSIINLTTTAILTSVSTFRFHANSTLQPKKRKELSLFASPRFIDTFVHFDNAVKKEEKTLLTKIKTPTLNRLDKKSIKLASVVLKRTASNEKIKFIC